MDLSSICVKEDHNHNSNINPHVSPIYASSSFRFEKIEDSIDIFTGKTEGYVYSRYNNPSIENIGNKIAKMEGYDINTPTFGLMTSSGMSAIYTLLTSLLSSGEKILTSGNIYGGSTELFNKVFAGHQILSSFHNLSDANLIESLLKKDSDIKLIYLETPSNPTLDCVDLQSISDLAKKYGVYTVVDNTFATPFLQRPFNHGIDFIVHSNTKYLNGHGNSISGIIVGKDIDDTKKKIWTTLKLNGATCNPWDAWLTNQGIKTLALRMKAHSSNSSNLAQYLLSQSKVNKVNHLSLSSHSSHEIAKKQMSDWGGMLSFEVGRNIDDALKFVNALRFCTQAPTLGDVDTLVLHPATSSHLNIDKKLRLENNISDNLIRLSVGIENIDDIILDIDQALESL